MLMIVTLVGVVTVCAYFILTYNYGYWKNRGVPHPPVSLLFGNVGETLFLKKSLGQIYNKIYNDYPSLRYVGFYKIKQPGIVLRDPELIREVLIKNFSSFHDNDIFVNEDVDPLIQKNPTFIRGEKWKISRNQLIPFFTSKQIKSLFGLMEAVSKKLANYLEETNSLCVDVKELSAKFTTDVVANCAFGLEANSFTDPNSEFRKMGRKLLSQSFLTSIKHLLILVLPTLARILRIKFIPDDAAKYFLKIISQTMEYRKTHGVVRYDFLEMMLEYKRKLGEDAFSDQDITAHAIGFLIDGFETSSVVLSFALFELAANPDVQAKLKKEIEESMKKNSGKVTYDSVHEMVYLDKFFSENLRKHPPGLFVAKVCTKPFKLPSPDGSKLEVNIEPETSIVVPIYSLHYDPHFYPDPENFDPERFSEENNQARVKCIYLPFGDGPRMCIGHRFGTTEIKTALVYLVSKFKIQVNRKTVLPLEIDPTYIFLAAKGGIWLDFYKRAE